MVTLTTTLQLWPPPSAGVCEQTAVLITLCVLSRLVQLIKKSLTFGGLLTPASAKLRVSCLFNQNQVKVISEVQCKFLH